MHVERSGFTGTCIPKAMYKNIIDSRLKFGHNKLRYLAGQNIIHYRHFNVYYRCTCGNCALMPTGKECRCCTSFSAVDDRRESQQLTCITDHPGFEGNCLNRWVLETSYYEFIQDEGPLDADQLIHELVLHTISMILVLYLKL